jgi:O-antigen ligase
MSWVAPDGDLNRDVAFRRVVMASIIAWMVGSFDAIDISPTKFVGVCVVAVGATLAFSPAENWAKIRIPLPIVAFVMWWIASVLWTIDTGQWLLVAKAELIPLLALLTILLVGRPDDVLQGFLLGVVLLVLYTVVIAIIQPETRTGAIGPFGEVLPGLRGPFPHKNQLAPFLLIGYYSLIQFAGRRIVVALLPVVGIMFALTRSTTGLLLLIVMVATHLWLSQWRRQDVRSRRGYVAVSAVLAVFGGFLWVAIQPLLLAVSGKDPTLTGRTEIWSVVWNFIGQRPVLGWAPGSLWVNQGIEPTRTVSQTIGFYVFHAHNGYLELMLELGLVGLALFALLMLGVFRLGSRRLKTDFALGQWAIVINVTLLIYSMSEIGTAGQWLSMTWLSYVLLLRSEEMTTSEHSPLGDRTVERYS